MHSKSDWKGGIVRSLCKRGLECIIMSTNIMIIIKLDLMILTVADETVDKYPGIYDLSTSCEFRFWQWSDMKQPYGLLSEKL